MIAVAVQATNDSLAMHELLIVCWKMYLGAIVAGILKTLVRVYLMSVSRAFQAPPQHSAQRCSPPLRCLSAVALPLQPNMLSAQHSTAQHSTVQHSTAQHSTAQHSTAVAVAVAVAVSGAAGVRTNGH